MPKVTRGRRKLARTNQTSFDDAVDDAYGQLLSDAAASGEITKSDRPLKRRKIKGEGNKKGDFANPIREEPERQISSLLTPADLAQPFDKPYESSLDDSQEEAEQEHGEPGASQTIYDDSDTSVDSDIDWENVLGSQLDPGAGKADSDLPLSDSKELQIELEKPNSRISKRSASQRLPSSNVEKRKRVDVHKLHVLALLGHLYIRNAWCNDIRIHVRMHSVVVDFVLTDSRISLAFTQTSVQRPF